MNRHSLILDTTVRLVFDGALLLSVYLLFAGHNQPGGGFVGGLVAAGAIALRFLAGGLDDVRSLLRIRPWVLLAAGLGLAAVSATVPVLVGDAALDHEAIELTIVALGKVKATSATIFDTGVYLVVVSLLLMILEALGDEAEPDAPFPSEEHP